MHDTTFLFTDIEGSTRLWEEQPERMRPALAAHDALVREVVERHGGRVVKMTGDGVHAAFTRAPDAIEATLALQSAVSRAIPGIELRIRCGLHAGPSEVRDGDYFGSTVNRAARIMSAAHGGQVLLSAAVAERTGARLPAGASLRDLGAVRLRDLSDAERVFQLLHPALRSEFPALRSLERTPNNLPHEMTSFVGRDRELATVGALLREHRLVTVVGMGGMGKSRLATHVAAEVLEDFPDGAWRVELAGVVDPNLVPQEIASTLRVAEAPGHSVMDALSTHLRERTTLLVLDNCEHLVEAAARTARALLQAAPRLKVLATSREMLQLAGEAVFPVSSLAFPGPLAVDSVAIGGFDAVRLFAERAAAAAPGFEITPANAVVVGAICNRLDGIPLALELAAARMRSLPVEELAARLHDKFRLLRTADPTVLPRQRTLLALLEWSHDLLSPQERTLLHDVSAFAGSWSLEAAEAIGTVDESEPEMVVDLLARLVEKSLIVFDPRLRRYHLLETVRDFAAAKLAAEGRVGQLRRRHFDFFLHYAETAKSSLTGPDQGAVLARLDAERENILAALTPTGSSGADAEHVLKLASAMKHYWFSRGLLELGERVTREALQRPGAPDSKDAYCRALFDCGQIDYFMGRHAEAREVLERSLAVARELREPRKVQAVLQPLGLAALAGGDGATARRYLTEAVAIARQLDIPREVATACNMLGQLLRVESSFDEAEALFRECIGIAKAEGDRESQATALLNLSMVLLNRNEQGAALKCLQEAWAIAQSLASRLNIAPALEVTGALTASWGEHALALRLYGAANAEARRVHLWRDTADEAFHRPWIRASTQALGEAAAARCEEEGRALSLDEAIGLALGWTAATAPQPVPCH